MSEALYRRGPGSGGPRVLIATQSPDGKVHAPFLASLVATLNTASEHGWAIDFLMEAGNCHVDDARNTSVRNFLMSDCDYLFFIDADVGWEPEGFWQLMSREGDVVCGAYPYKCNEEDYPVIIPPGAMMEGGLIEVEGAPAGFMRLSRKCLETMTQARGTCSFIRKTGGPPVHVLFERLFANGRRTSGDLSFCQKWRDLGGKVLVDAEIDFVHEGHHRWKGRLSRFMRAQDGLPPLGMAEALRDMPAEGAAERVHRFANCPNAAPPTLLRTLYRIARGKRVLETGSGLTTIVAALAGAEVHALEHDLHSYRRTLAWLEHLGLSACVHYAPLDPETGWYFLPESLPATFDIVVCDGPEGKASDFTALGSMLADRIDAAHWIVAELRDETETGRSATLVNDLRTWVFAPAGKDTPASGQPVNDRAGAPA